MLNIFKELSCIFLQERAMHGSLTGFIDTSEGSKEYSVVAYSSLLRNEVLGTGIEVNMQVN